MIKQIEEYGIFVGISGFRNVVVKDEKALLHLIRDVMPVDADFQLFNADLVASWEHLYFAALNALVAFKGKVNLSNSVGMETALYASAQRQIKKALELIGLKPGTSNVALVVIADSEKSAKEGVAAVGELLDVAPDESVLDVTAHKEKIIRHVFGISENEINAVSKDDPKQALIDLVIERVALLSTRL